MFFDDEGEIDTSPLKSSVILKPYRERPLKPVRYMATLPYRRTLIIDTEVYWNYFLFAFRDLETGEVGYLEESPTSKLNKHELAYVMQGNKTIGFNSIKYDLPLIWLAYVEPVTEIIKRASDKLIKHGYRENQLASEFGFKIHPTDHIDLIEVCPLKGSLKTYGARLHSERIQDLPFDPDLPLTQDQSAIIKSYCISNDLETTTLVANNLKEQLDLRAELSKEYGVDVRSKSDAQIAEAVIGTELRKLLKKRLSPPKIEPDVVYRYEVPSFIAFITPQMQKVLEVVRTADYTLNGNGSVNVPDAITKLKIKMGSSVYRMGNGGLHSSEKNTCHKADEDYFLQDRDVTSYYPMIILNCKLFPQHLGEAFLKIYKALVDRRVEAKREKLNAIADALKIVVNGSFGKLGSPFSILYSPDLLLQVTVTGQLSLLMLIEMLQEAAISVVSANTDGVVIRCRRDAEAAMGAVVGQWERATGFVTEAADYGAIYSRDVNAYLAVKTDGSVKGKNVYFDPWSGGPKAAIFRFHKNPTCTICIEAASKLITDNVPIEQTIYNSHDIKKFVAVKNVTGGAHKDCEYLGKIVRWYYAVGEYGQINYVLNGNKVPDSDGAKPLMDLPETFPNDINYEWYIERTKAMLTDLRYYEPERQRSFFE